MSIENENLKNIIEAALFAADKPLSLDQIMALFQLDERPERADVKELLQELTEDYKERGLELKSISSGYRFQVKQEYSAWISRLWEEKPPRYTRALLETLSLIAYRQPITRAEIEDVRGVAVSSNIIKTLQERQWVKIVGHKDVPGRPALLATTKEFLDYFNLKSLEDLPTLAEIKSIDQINITEQEFEPEDEKLMHSANLLEQLEDNDEEVDLDDEETAEGMLALNADSDGEDMDDDDEESDEEMLTLNSGSDDEEIDDEEIDEDVNEDEDEDVKFSADVEEVEESENEVEALIESREVADSNDMDNIKKSAAPDMAMAPDGTLLN